MAYVSKDELFDVSEELSRDMERAVDKLELRLESNIAGVRNEAVRAMLMTKEFQQVQEAIDDIREDIKRILGRQKRMLSIIETMAFPDLQEEAV